jgi:hypothetical protein
MWHPVVLLPFSIFWPFLVVTLLVMALFQFLDRPLRTPASPWGVVSFELAGSVDKARSIINSWDDHARLSAAFGLGLDYLFMVLYATTIAIACLWSGNVYGSLGWPLANLGDLIAWGVWFAALLDGIENYSLWRLLSGPISDPWPKIAWWCASIKFILITIGMIYGIAGGIVYLLM